MAASKATAFALQGGGALGAYELGVLKALQERRIKADIITGVSIGSINAAIFASHPHEQRIEALERFWFDKAALHGLHEKLVEWMPGQFKQVAQLGGNRGVYRLNLGLLNPFRHKPSFYSSKPLKKTLEACIDFDYLNSEHAPHVLIQATEVASGEVARFENRGGQRIEVEHILASSSLAPLFPATQIDEQYYWDGAFYNNTPIKSAIALLQELEVDKRCLFVAELFPRAGQVPRNMEQVADRIMELLASTKVHLETEQAREQGDLAELIQSIETRLPYNEHCEKLRDHPIFQKMLAYRPIHVLGVVALQRKETALSILDFSKEAVTQRQKEGYEDTLKSLKSKRN